MRAMLLLVVVATMLACMAGAAEVDRTKRCGSDSDCVMVKDIKGGGQLLIDGLNLANAESGESAKVVEERLPSWFGPKRPLQFTYKGKVLDKSVPLGRYGIAIGEVVEMTTADEEL